MRELSANEIDLFVDQLERTAAMLAVLMQDVDEYATEQTKDRIRIELRDIFKILRDAEKGDLCNQEEYWSRLDEYRTRHALTPNA